jgi:hypothetical protein
MWREREDEVSLEEALWVYVAVVNTIVFVLIVRSGR